MISTTAGRAAERRPRPYLIPVWPPLRSESGTDAQRPTNHPHLFRWSPSEDHGKRRLTRADHVKRCRRHDGRSVAEVRDLWRSEDGAQTKPHPSIPALVLVRRRVDADRDDVFHFRIVNTKKGSTQEVGTCSWADRDPSGALVFARGGTIFRSEMEDMQPATPIELAAFSAETFERVVPPAWAHEWPR